MPKYIPPIHSDVVYTSESDPFPSNLCHPPKDCSAEERLLRAIYGERLCTGCPHNSPYNHELSGYLELKALTPIQQAKFNKAIGDNSDWPQFTDDPYINWLVDCRADPDNIEPYDPTLYEKEIERVQELG